MAKGLMAAMTTTPPQVSNGRLASCNQPTPLLHSMSFVKPFTTLPQTRSAAIQRCVQRRFTSRVWCHQEQQAEPQVTTRRRLLLAGKAVLLSAACPCCTQIAQASGAEPFRYAGEAGPSSWPGTCTIGQQQSPINIPLADHLAQSRVASSEKKHESAGFIKFSFEQSIGNGKDVKFNFEQQVEKSANTKFKFEQKVEEFGDIKFGFETNLYEQKLDRFGDISFHYDNQSAAAVSNPGHGTPQVKPPKGNTIQVGDKKMELIQWHFHTPSEHAFDGERKSMEAHLVHKDSEGRLAVIGVMLQEGTSDPNPAVRYALENVPEAAGQEKSTGQQSMQLQSLLPQPESNGHRPYIHYVGSLTTPPCSEEVQWFVFTDIVVIPGRQVEQFQQFADKANLGVPANARPLMPLNGRSLDYAYL